MEKLTIKVKKEAEEQGLYVTECKDNVDLEKNYMVGMHGRAGSTFFKSYEDVKLFLGIK